MTETHQLSFSNNDIVQIKLSTSTFLPDVMCIQRWNRGVARVYFVHEETLSRLGRAPKIAVPPDLHIHDDTHRLPECPIDHIFYLSWTDRYTITFADVVVTISEGACHDTTRIWDISVERNVANRT